MPHSSQLIVRHLPAYQDYTTTWQRMRDFTLNRDASTIDEMWFLEHPPVFTQGQAGKPEHVLDPENIPVVQTDRGGQVTYHGPGALVVYFLLDLRRKKIKIREFVSTLEQSVVAHLENEHQLSPELRCDAPGIYIEQAKICSIGVRIRKGCSYHGISFNVNCDLHPFSLINPCGYPDLKMTKIADFVPEVTVLETRQKLLPYLTRLFEYDTISITDSFDTKIVETT